MAHTPTIKDIAERAGVSTYAVSQALAGKPGVAESTRGRIARIADSVGYVPNAVAAGLKSQSTKTIGVMTASGRNQYYSMLVQAIDGVLQQEGFHAVTSDAMRGGTYSATLEEASVDQLLQQRVAAVVATYSLNERSLAKIRQWGVPVIFVDSLPPEHGEGAPFIGSNNRLASRKVADHFAERGYLAVAFLAFPPEWNTRAPREAGFVERCEELGVEVEVIECENTVESASSAVQARLGIEARNAPEAVYAANTVLLQGALKAIRKSGFSVPEDIGVLGFDDFDWAELVDPPISVVDQHIEEIGRTAAEVVLDLIHRKRKPEEGIHIEVEPELILRESTSPSSRTPDPAHPAA